MRNRSVFVKVLYSAISIFLSTSGYSQNESSNHLPIFPELDFKKNSVFLTANAKKILDSAVTIINGDTSYKIKIIGFDASCETCMQYSWDRVFSVLKYLKQNRVDSSRIIFIYGQEGNPLKVNLISTIITEEGPDWVPPPIPCFSSIN